MGILAGGVLTVVGLYSYGYRESAQSREDVGAAAVADAVLGQLTMALSATNLTWSTFKSLSNYPSDEGWGYFLDSTAHVTKDPTSQAKSDFQAVMAKLSSGCKGSLNCDTAFPESALNNTGLCCGLVILHENNSSIVQIGFKAMRHRTNLLAAPIFYTEVKFMGVDE